MARSIIFGNQIVYRTSLFCSLAAAQGFAKCLKANSRFQNVLVNRSQKSKTEKYFVTFEPTNTCRVQALRTAQQEARCHRAETQEFIIWPDQSGRFHHVFSVASGNTYQVNSYGCNCEDSQYSCSKVGLRCKHRIALANYLRSEETVAA